MYNSNVVKCLAAAAQLASYRYLHIPYTKTRQIAIYVPYSNKLAIQLATVQLLIPSFTALAEVLVQLHSYHCQLTSYNQHALHNYVQLINNLIQLATQLSANSQQGRQLLYSNQLATQLFDLNVYLLFIQIQCCKIFTAVVHV